MLAVELNTPCGGLVDKAANKGLLINVTAESVIRLLPTLNLTTDDADQLVNLLSEVIKQGL